MSDEKKPKVLLRVLFPDVGRGVEVTLDMLEATLQLLREQQSNCPNRRVVVGDIYGELCFDLVTDVYDDD